MTPALTIVSTVDPNDGISNRFVVAASQFLNEHHITGEIILVDDVGVNMRPPTPDHVTVRLLRTPGKIGQLRATVMGLTEARGTMILAMDTDMTHNIADIPRFMQAMTNGHDLVFGRRVRREDVGAIRVQISRALNWVFRRLGNSGVDDINTPMVMLSARALEALRTMPGEAASPKLYLLHLFASSTSEVDIVIKRTPKKSSYSIPHSVVIFLARLAEALNFNRYYRNL